MPFIGAWKMLAGGSDYEPEPIKPLICVKVLDSQRQAVDDNGNTYDIMNSIEHGWFSSTPKLKFEAGKIYLAEVAVTYSKSIGKVCGTINLIRISWIGSRIYL